MIFVGKCLISSRIPTLLKATIIKVTVFPDAEE
jgi:hypothetical protein